MPAPVPRILDLPDKRIGIMLLLRRHRGLGRPQGRQP